MILYVPSQNIFLYFIGRRKPAWTDRILHMSTPSLNLQQVIYTSHPDISMSDHRPISAELALQVCHIHPTVRYSEFYSFATNQLEIIDAQKYDAFAFKLYHSVSEFEKAPEPAKMKLSRSTIDFGKISSVISQTLFRPSDSQFSLQIHAASIAISNS